MSGPKVGAGEWPPRFAKIRISFDDGGELVMTDGRRLGRILLREDPRAEPPVSRLGFDPLLAMPGPRAFARMLEGRKAVIKALLLDQQFAGRGWATGLPTRCSTRPASPPTGAPIRSAKRKCAGCVRGLRAS